jgi:DNA-binding IclR family transcriptional regulator
MRDDGLLKKQKTTDEAPHQNHGTYFVPGLERGLHVLETVGESDKPMTISEIGRSIGVSRSSAFRLVYTLRHMGFLKAVYDDRAFELGPRILNLGFSYLNRQDIVRQARPLLQQLTDRTQISSHLAVRDSRDVLYLDCVVSKTPFVTNIPTGARAAAHAAPLGWVLLGSLGDEELRALYEQRDMKPATPHTPTTLNALMSRVHDAARIGHVVSRGFNEPGGSSISAPVHDHAGAIIAGIDISGPDVAFDFDLMYTHYVPTVLETARGISAALGHRP